LPTYERGDYVKVECAGDAGMPGEWMWVRVHRCDDKNQLVFGALDNVPLNDESGKLTLGIELAISFTQIREHKKSADFESKN
jgi:hypothetical protein